MNTGYISPQFHIVFDELFDTVASEVTIDLSETWIDLFLNSRETYLEGWDESADGPLPEIGSEWLPDTEKPLTAEEAPLPQQPPTPDPPTQESRPSQGEAPAPDPSPVVEPALASTPADTVTTDPTDISGPLTFEPLDDDPNPQGVHDVSENTAPRPRRRTQFTDSSQGESSSSSPARRQSSEPPRRTSRSNPPAVFEEMSYKGRALVFEVDSRVFSHVPISTSADVVAFAVADWETVTADPYYDYFHTLFTSQIDPETLFVLDIEQAFHPFAFAAKIQSEDFPSYGDIIRMQGEERRKWMDAMDAEMKELAGRKAFEFVPREEPIKLKKQVVKSLWAFRRKRRPDGTISRCKARLVVRGDLQKGQFSASETFAPVVEWSTVRMLFSLSVMHNWKSVRIH